MAGEAWEVHGGGFYHVQKYLTAPAKLPEHLTWFKWEAYLTWVSGFLLLIVQYYFNAEAYLIDPAVMALSPWQAIAISVVSLIASGGPPMTCCAGRHLARRPDVLAGCVFALILVAAYCSMPRSFRAAARSSMSASFIGTIMAANVFMVIIPNQRKITAALLRGEAPDPALGAIGKQRSLHNTYLTLPVLLMMISNHYPMLSNRRHVWLVVGAVVVGGAALRHFLVRHEVGDPLAKIAWTLPIIFGLSVFA